MSKNHCVLKRIFNKIFLVWSFIFLFSYLPASAQLTWDDENNKTNFRLKFVSTIVFKNIKPGNFDNIYSDGSVLLGDIHQSGVTYENISFYFSTYINDNNGGNDFGFLSDQSTKFLITNYVKEPEKYVESITIKWKKELPEGFSNGNLVLQGRYNEPYQNTENIDWNSTNEDVVNLIMRHADADEEGIAVYTFDRPVRFIAFSGEPTESSNQLTRFEYFELHFVTDPIPLISFSDEETINIPWSNKGINREDFLSIKYGTDQQTVQNLGLEFFLQPLFEPQAKPAITDLTVEQLKTHEWSLYKLMEENSIAYDGYLESSDEILCNYSNKTGHEVLELPVPCSGLYKLSARSNNNSLINVVPVILNIWPDVTNVYSALEEHNIGKDVQRFSINWVPFDTNEGGECIGYPYADENDHGQGAWHPDEISIWTPGLYNCQLYYKIEGGHRESIEDSKSKIKRDAQDPTLEGYTLYSDNSRFNLYDLQDGQPAKLSVKVAKNGALTPNIGNGTNDSENLFTIKLDTTEIPTYIQEVAEEAKLSNAIEYYNINGIKVKENNLTPGIYIIKQGTKTRKAVIK